MSKSICLERFKNKLKELEGKPFFEFIPLAFIGKTGKQVARECYEKFGDITTEEGWKRLKDYNDSL